MKKYQNHQQFGPHSGLFNNKKAFKYKGGLSIFHQQQNQQQQSESIQKKYKNQKKFQFGICWCPFYIIAILFLAGTLVELILIYFAEPEYYKPELQKLDYMFENIHSEPIIDIVMTIKENCPLEYEKEDIGQWPGTVRGCFCPEMNMLIQGECLSSNNDRAETGSSESSSSSEFGGVQFSECFQLTKIQKVPLYKWRQRNLCVLRADYVSYKLKTQKCPKDRKQCTSTVCIPLKESCPLTYFKIVQKNNDVFTPTPPGVFIQELQQEDLVVWTKTEQMDGQPIHKIEITMNSNPCMNPNLTPGRMDGKKYPLEPLEYYQGCDIHSENTENSQYIDSLKELEVYDQNKIQYQGQWQKLPGYRIFLLNSQDEFKLISRQKLLVQKNSCFNLKKVSIEQASQELQQIKDFLNIFFWYLVFATLILFLLILVFLMNYKRSVKGKNNTILIFLILTCLYMSAVTITQGSQYFYKRSHIWVDNIQYLRQFHKENCFPQQEYNDYVSYQISQILDQFDKPYNFIVFLFWLGVVTPFILIFMIIFVFIRAFFRKKRISIQMKNDNYQPIIEVK